MENARLVATVWLIAFAAFAWGTFSQRYLVFPYSIVNEMLAYFYDDPVPLMDKIANDFNNVPKRLIQKSEPDKTVTFKPLALGNLNERRSSPQIFTNHAPQGFRLLVGAFDFKGAMWGALLLDETGRVVHTWELGIKTPERPNTSDINRVLYGVGIFPDGSIVYNMQDLLMKRDFCGKLLWDIAEPYHHVVSPSEDYKTFWTFGGHMEAPNPTLVELDAASGKVVRTISEQDIQKQNPGLFIFDLRNLDTQAIRADPEKMNYPHPNDIEPLPAKYSNAFPEFKTGDLLVNYHMTNLVYVLDPDTLKVKFWYFGAGDGAHDTDWQADGTISILNNSWRSQWNSSIPKESTIVSIDPKRQAHHVIWNDTKKKLFTHVMGRSEMTTANTLLITSSTQGRVIEINRDTNETVFEFINDYNTEKQEVLLVAEAFYLPKDFFGFDISAPSQCH